MTHEQLRMQMLSGIITEGEYKAIINKEIEDAEKASLNESMIGGIVGIGAINQIPPREKTDYELAFEHFLGERYEKHFENREQDPYTMEEEEEEEEDYGTNIVTGKKLPKPDPIVEEEVNEGKLDGLYMELKDVLFPYYTDLVGKERVSMIDDVIKELNSYILILQDEKKAKQ